MLNVYLSMLNTQEDRDKFEVLYRKYEQKMYAVAFSILQNQQDAEDAVYESFQSIINNIEKIDDPECCKTCNYIVTIVKNTAITMYRKQKSKTIISMQEESFLEKEMIPSMNVESIILQNEEQDMLVRVLLSLPEKYRYVLYFYYYQELTYREIAESLNLTEANARQIAKRARQMLKEKLQGWHDER